MANFVFFKKNEADLNISSHMKYGRKITNLGSKDFLYFELITLFDRDVVLGIVQFFVFLFLQHQNSKMFQLLNTSFR